jgi:Omp85 superfamily domain
MNPLRTAHAWRAALLLTTVALCAGAAPPDSPSAPASPPPSAASPKRTLPDYDGRGPPPTSAGEVALWVPRVILSPLYVTSEFVVRRPLGALMTSAERSGWPMILYNFFTFGPEHNAGFAPIAFVDFGFLPAVGVYIFWNDAFFKGQNLHFHGSAWSGDWLAGSLTDRITVAGDTALTLKVTGIRRPDHAFYGEGPSTLNSYRSRYGEDNFEGYAMLEVPFWRSSRVKAGVGVRAVNLYPGHYASDPSLEQRAASGAFVVPDGFNRGYTEEYNYVLASLDTRKDVATGSGARVEIEAEQGTDVRRSPVGTWIRYNATAGVFYDLNDYGRIVSLSAAALFAEPLGNEPIPFTELVTLGGDRLMRGFVPGRLVDRSAAVATLRYRWPIAFILDGSIQAAVGNVFGVQLEQFKLGLLRFSGAIGVETVGSTDGSFQALFGIGTETFDHGGQVDSIRFVLGTNRGF